MHPVSTDHCSGTCISTIARPCQRDEDSAGVQGRIVGQLGPSALLPAPPPADPLPAGGQAGPGGGPPAVDHCQLLPRPAQMREINNNMQLVEISFMLLIFLHHVHCTILIHNHCSLSNKDLGTTEGALRLPTNCLN